MTIPSYDPKLIHPLFPRACSVLTRSETEGAGGALFVPVEIAPTTWNQRITSPKMEPTQSSRMYKDDRDFTAHGGEHRFSEMAYSSLFGHHGSFQEYVQTAKMTTYGLSCDQIADVLERDSRTILQWQQALGKKSQRFHLALCTLIGLTLTFIQMDEIWSYLKRKKRQLWVFITLEAETKFWINFELGSRTGQTANPLLKNLVSLMRKGFEHFLLITTDKLAASEKAIANNLKKVHYAYLQIVKQRRNKRLVTVKKRIVQGKEANFGFN